jgi:hypothetical protein
MAAALTSPPRRWRGVTSSARKMQSGRRRSAMSTDLMEAYSLEVGDQITVQGEVYRIVEIEDGDTLDYRFVLVDEEGYRRHIEAEFSKKFRIVLDSTDDL